MGKYPRVLIFDCMAICHYVKHSLRAMQSHSGTASGVLYGFMGTVLRVSTRFPAKYHVFAWDSRNSVRKEMFSGYKAGRVKKDKTEAELIEDQEFFDQVDLLREEVLKELGFPNVFTADGFEADDIIAEVTRIPKFRHFMVSRDHDLLQLLDRNVVMVDYMKLQVVTLADFKERYGIEPREWCRVKALAGCSTDCVPGVKGVGEKTALKYLLGELPPHTKAHQSIVSPEGRQIYRRNRRLVRLPHPAFPHEYTILRNQTNPDKFLKFFKKYDMDSYAKDIERFSVLY